MSRNVALVLSSGGARGFAHIGAIKVLEKQGYTITSVAGTSMGALVGGIHASGRISEFEDWVSSLDVMEVLKLTDITLSSKGFVKGTRVIEKLKEIVHDRDIEDLPIPYCAIATDLIRGRERIFSSGSLFNAIRASISIPTFFQPFSLGGDYYVDGGLVNPIPINRVKRSEGDLLAVVNVNADIPPVRIDPPGEIKEKGYHRMISSINDRAAKHIPKDKKDDIGLFNLNNRSISIMLNQIAALTLRNYHIDIMVSISKESYGTYDFYKAAEIIREGERATSVALLDLHGEEGQNV
ncbi:MAG: patatin-like phospholipase family protein [Bacteroidales bacterium]|jgi:NTE family protein|nr:patatin-like phospholipase family protein [Bacteroidales bacterium]